MYEGFALVPYAVLRARRGLCYRRRNKSEYTHDQMPSDSTLEKPLPNHLDAERSVLGAVILDNNALNAAIENLKPDDFFLDQHRRVFTQMIALGEAQQAIRSEERRVG